VRELRIPIHREVREEAIAGKPLAILHASSVAFEVAADRQTATAIGPTRGRGRAVRSRGRRIERCASTLSPPRQTTRPWSGSLV